MSLDTITLSPGAIVTYEDMANPLRTYEVEERVMDKWGTFFRLRDINEPGEPTTQSDCRQHGWNLIKEGR